MPRLARLLAALAVAAMAACAQLPPGGPVDELWRDAHFAAPATPVDADALFALSEPMREFIAAERLRTPADPRRALAAALRGRSLRIEYDGALTRTAAQTFDARAGNCLSLVVMTAALAKALGVPVQFQSVAVDPAWSRRGDLLLVAGHVNVSLGRRPSRAARADEVDRLVIDFLPPQDLRGLRAVPLAESTVVAMYLNNRAAELLAGGDVDAAYWHARAALRHDPAFLAARNTLAVVYLRRGLPAAAEQVLHSVLAADARHTTAIANLVPVLERLGRTDEAQAWRERLARVEAQVPLHFLALGQAAMREGRFRDAAASFARELDRDPQLLEARFGLAAAHEALGEREQARRELANVLRHGPTTADRERAAAKLARLQAEPR